jgi:hypothetical protein
MLRDPGALLWFLLALPLALLYFVRPTPRTARVGSLLIFRLLAKRRAARAPLARLERLLSLLLNVAALALVALALTRPTLGPLSPRRIVAILDAGASMASRLDGSTRFERALARSRELARELRPEDELGFVLAGATPHLLLAPTPRAAHPERALESARLEGGRKGLADALALAYALEPTEVRVFSDGAGPALEGAPAAPAGTVLTFERLGHEDDSNAGIVALAARAVPGTESTVEVQATLVNASARPASIRPTYSLDGKTLVALEPVDVGPWTRANLPPRRMDLPEGGVLGLHIETPGDVLDRDDDAYVIVPPVRPTRVRSPGSPFLDAALEADDTVALVGEGADADVTVGESLVLGPEAVASVASRFELGDRGTVMPPRITRIAREHPVLRHVSLDDAVFTKARLVDAPPDWRPLVQAGDVPLVLARDADGRRALVFTFAPEGSDLVLRRAWPLLVANAVSWLHGEALRESEPPVHAGAVARLPLPRMAGTSAPFPAATRVVRDGEPVPSQQEPGVVTVTETSRPGVYEVLAGDVRLARFAVSLLDEEASHVAPHALGIGERPAPRPRPEVASIEPAVFASLLALLLLLLESWVHHRSPLG